MKERGGEKDGERERECLAVSYVMLVLHNRNIIIHNFYGQKKLYI